MPRRKSVWEINQEKRRARKEAMKNPVLSTVPTKVEDLPVKQPAPVLVDVPDLTPDNSWRKKDIQEWLIEHNISYSSFWTKKKLLTLVE